MSDGEGKCKRKGHQRCSPWCPPRHYVTGERLDGLGALCLLCFNTGCRIPTGDKSPSIDRWIEMHPGTVVPPKVAKAQPAQQGGGK